MYEGSIHFSFPVFSLHIQFVVDNKKAQKYLLIGFEKLVGEVHPHLLAKVPHVIKAFYDEDILDEESILEWADKVTVSTLLIYTAVYK